MPKVTLSTYSLFLKKNYREAMHFAVEHGFGGIEIWSNVFDFWPKILSAREIDTISAVARENNISLATHFCGGNNLADSNEGHLGESMEQLKETVRLCRKIGAGILVIHPGMAPRMSIHDKGSFDQYPQFSLTTLKRNAIARFKESLKEATRFAEKNDVVLGLENFGHVKGCIQSTFEELVEWVDEIGNPALQITLDIGHANLEGGVEKAIEIFGSRIKHVHLNDNNGISSDHGELGTGTIDWKTNASFLRSFEGMLSLELLGFDDIEGTVLRSKSFLERLLDEE
ncbi:MAG: TIM barrel protein [Proteobacteria bacterium]|nr:TIM barrel protein [Pseudomonadota bacterium]